MHLRGPEDGLDFTLKHTKLVSPFKLLSSFSIFIVCFLEYIGLSSRSFKMHYRDEYWDRIRELMNQVDDDGMLYSFVIRFTLIALEMFELYESCFLTFCFLFFVSYATP